MEDKLESNPRKNDLPQEPVPRKELDETKPAQQQAEQPPRQEEEPQRTIDKTQIIAEATLADMRRATAEKQGREKEKDHAPVEGEILCFQAMFPNYAGQVEQDPLQVFKATADPDTLYHHEAMKEADADKIKGDKGIRGKETKTSLR